MTTERDQAGVRRAAAGRRVPHARGGGALALRGRLDRRHERHARGDDPAALVVRRRGVARPRADADARDPRAPRGRDPRVQAGEVLAGRRDLRAARRATRAASTSAASTRARSRASRAPRRPRRSSPPCAARPATITKLETSTKKERAPLLYDLTSLQRDANTRYGFSARRTLAAAQRLYEEHKALTYPRTNSRFLSTDMIGEIKPTVEGVGKNPVYAAPAKYVDAARRPAARPRDQRRQGHRPPRDHPDALRAPHGQDVRRRQEGLRHGRAALPRRLPPRRRVGEHAARDHRRRAHLPHPRPRAARAGLARRLRRGRGGLRRGAGDRRRRGRPDAAEARRRRARRHARGGLGREGDQAAAALLRRVAAGRDGGGRQGARRRRRCASR